MTAPAAAIVISEKLVGAYIDFSQEIKEFLHTHDLAALKRGRRKGKAWNQILSRLGRYFVKGFTTCKDDPQKGAIVSLMTTHFTLTGMIGERESHSTTKEGFLKHVSILVRL